MLGQHPWGRYSGPDEAGARISPRLLFVFQMKELYKNIESYQDVVIDELT